MKRRVRVVQFGLSHEHADGKLATLRALPDEFEIVGVVDDRDGASPRWPPRRPDSVVDGLPVLTEEQVWAGPPPDAALVEVTNADLLGVARRVLDRGLPMHLDKPGGETCEPYVSLRAEAKARGVPVQMGYMFRANPAIQWIVEAVRQGWLGDVFEVAADMDHAYGDDAYRRYLGTFKGGILYNLGCHIVDFVVSMLGEPESALPAIGTAPGSPEGARDNGASILRYGSGALVFVRACGRKTGGGGAARRLRVSGTLGTVELCPIERFDGRPLTLEVYLSRPVAGLPRGRQTLDFGPQGTNGLVDRYAAQLRQFAAIVRGEEKEPEDLCEHDIAVQRTVLKMVGLM